MHRPNQLDPIIPLNIENKEWWILLSLKTRIIHCEILF